MAEERWDYAGFGDRFLADLCDGAIAILVALLAYLLIDRWMFGHQSGFWDEKRPSSAADFAWWAWFLWNLTYLVGSTGQSWGRKVVGIKVVGAEGGAIGVWRALGRNLFAGFISAPTLYLGFLWVIWDGQKQAWHDKVFRTYVLKRVATQTGSI